MTSYLSKMVVYIIVYLGFKKTNQICNLSYYFFNYCCDILLQLITRLIYRTIPTDAHNADTAPAVYRQVCVESISVRSDTAPAVYRQVCVESISVRSVTHHIDDVGLENCQILQFRQFLPMLNCFSMTTVPHKCDQYMKCSRLRTILSQEQQYF